MDASPLVRRLREAPFTPVGRFASASNATLLVRLTDRDPRSLDQLATELGRDPELDDLDPVDLAVHKPRRGEAPLWDFPDGTLHRREIAAYELDAALGWDLVPATVLRDDGPFGPGSLQRYVPHDPEHHYFHLLEHGDGRVRAQLQAMVVLDLLIDNADRKGGHVLLERAEDLPGGRLTGEVRLVDHGVSFSVDRKLRTVGWDFAGDPVPARLQDDVARLLAALAGTLGARLRQLLHPAEVTVLGERVRQVARLGVFPDPVGQRPYPWPLL